MAVLITGVAGFIGSNLAKALLDQGYKVFGIDNFCLGNPRNLSIFKNQGNFKFIETEMSNVNAYKDAVRRFHEYESIEEIWHLAANSEIMAGIYDSHKDLNNTFMTTFTTLEVMRSFNIKKLLFASSSAIYGDLGNRKLSEDSGPLLPISNYGAMKLAAEAIISAATEIYLEQSFIFRFPNVIGIPATHGVILDFVRKLKITPNNLDVLGNGRQQKSYLHVEDLIDAMLFIRKKSIEKVAVFNIGSGDDGVAVRFIAEETVREFSPDATIKYGEGMRGWIGDVPRFTFCVDKLNRLGWMAKNDSKNAVLKAIKEIIAKEGT